MLWNQQKCKCGVYGALFLYHKNTKMETDAPGQDSFSWLWGSDVIGEVLQITDLISQRENTCVCDQSPGVTNDINTGCGSLRYPTSLCQWDTTHSTGTPLTRTCAFSCKNWWKYRSGKTLLHMPTWDWPWNLQREGEQSRLDTTWLVS